MEGSYSNLVHFWCFLEEPDFEIPTKILLWGSFLMKYGLVPLLNLPRRCAFEIYPISTLPEQAENCGITMRTSHFWQLCGWVSDLSGAKWRRWRKGLFAWEHGSCARGQQLFWAPCRDWDCKGKGFEGKVKFLGFLWCRLIFEGYCGSDNPKMCAGVN